MIETVKKGFFSLLLWIVHLLYHVFESVDSWRALRRRKSCLPLDAGIEKLKLNLKIPNHIAFIANTSDETNYDLNQLASNVASLVSWSSVLQIEHITVYDVQGVLKDNKRLMESKIEKTLAKVPKDAEIVIKNGFTQPQFLLDNRNYLSKVKFLSSLDGRYALVELLKELAAEKRKAKDESPLTVDTIDEAVRKHYDFPDPDLAVILDSTPCVFGYPPWQLRLTEIFNLQTKGPVEFSEFVNILNRFSKCQQRFGK